MGPSNNVFLSLASALQPDMKQLAHSGNFDFCHGFLLIYMSISGPVQDVGGTSKYIDLILSS